MSKPAFYIPSEVPSYLGSKFNHQILMGPDGFECVLGEPEDCLWSRDGQDAVDRLNKQHDEIARLTARLAEAKRLGLAAAALIGCTPEKVTTDEAAAIRAALEKL